MFYSVFEEGNCIAAEEESETEQITFLNLILSISTSESSQRLHLMNCGGNALKFE